MARKNTQTATHLSSLYLSNATQAKIFIIWMKGSTSLFRPLSLNIIREVCSYIEFHPLLALSKVTCVIVFDPVEMRCRSIDFKQIRLPYQYTTRAECVCIANDRVFMCGGAVLRRGMACVSGVTFLISSKRAAERTRMKVPRTDHALYYDEATKAIFAFGGRDLRENSVKQCEEFHLAKKTWLPLPDLNGAKASPHICGYQRKVYIFAPDCEVFSIDTRQLAVLSLPIHSGIVPTIAVWNNQLLIFQGLLCGSGISTHLTL